MVRVDEELSAELLERAGRDQAARMSLRPGHRMEDWDTVVEPVDRDNTARLREIVDRHGWPGHRLVGEDAVARDDASPADLAYLKDRVLMRRGEPQVYGTQYQIRDGVLELWPVRDPSGLDQRRAALGLEPEAANRARPLAAEGLTGGQRDDEPAGGG
jgi:Family of unknown function (DUF6624)